LIDHGQFDRRPILIVPASGCSTPAIMRRASTCRRRWADDADDRAGRNAKIDIVHQEPVAVCFAHAAELDHLIAEALRDGDEISCVSLRR